MKLRPYLSRAVRAHSSINARALNPRHSIYVSRSTNPYFNLSLEDWLFRNKPHQEPLLLLYRDEPCVVIGRNQNPWKEVNLQLAAVHNVPFIRRRSGGGTVYHDLGNTNYSLHVPRSSFDRNETAEVIVRAVRSLGINAEVNERNDICAESFKMSIIRKNVSGSAYKIANNRAYHHGTMLISTELDSLGGLLHTTKETMLTKGVASVRSPVQNLRHFERSITHERFVAETIKSFQDEYGVHEEVQYVTEDENSLAVPAIQDGIEELKSWEWRYGQTPEFTYSVSRPFEWGEAKAEIVSKHGIITECKTDCQGISENQLDRLDQMLVDERYGFLRELKDDGIWGSAVDALRIQELWSWIAQETKF